MTDINLVVVCTEAYPMVYARKIITRFMQLTSLNCTPYCITDRRSEIDDMATPIPKDNHDVLGWWNKMQVYSKDMPAGYILYLDLDIVLIQNFDEEIEQAIEYLSNTYKKVACVSDAIQWMNNKYSSSMMLLESGAMSDLYEHFLKDRDTIMIQQGGDQVWTGRQLQENEVLYIDEYYPNLKKNLKFHLGQKHFDKWYFPKTISNQIKMVDCGGRPKPHDITGLDYITKNWHDVRV